VPQRAERQRELLRALREALDQQSLHLHYQPIVDVNERRVRGFECLARWKHGSWGNVVPATFIPVAEQSGDIVRLGQWALRQACHEFADRVGDRGLYVAVNVSAKQMMDESFLPHLEECLAQSGLAPEALVLELTESALAADLEHLRGVLESTRRLKVRIAVDDFGTGYSSLAYLNCLPIDVIKVDRAFVRDFNRGGKTIIKAALAIAGDFGQQVVIEGVETAQSLQQVREVGASLVQGFCFAEPMPLGAVYEWLRDFEGGSANGGMSRLKVGTP
jgi:diguanylate cyclase